LAYPSGHPMRRNLILAEASIKKIRSADIQAYHDRCIRPEATILSIAGDVDTPKIKSFLQERLGTWKAKGTYTRPELSVMPPVRGIRSTEIELTGKYESFTLLGHEGLHRKDPNYYPAFVANQVIGGSGLSSILMRTVRDRDGLTYGVYSQFKLSKGIRPWVVSFQSSPDHVNQAIQTIWDEVKKIQSGMLQDQDVEDSKEELIGSLVLSLETNQGIAHLNREIQYHDLGDDYLNQYPQAIRAISKKTVIVASQTWFHPDRYLEVTVKPAQRSTPTKQQH
jgi:zinc protease